MLQSSERILPRYLKEEVIVSGLWSMVKAGRVCGILELHWQTISVLVILTDSPILAVGPDSHSEDGLKVLWRVRHKSTVICVLQLEDPHSGQLGGCV